MSIKTLKEIDAAIKIARKKISENRNDAAQRICEEILIAFPHNKKAKDLLKTFQIENIVDSERNSALLSNTLQVISNLFNRELYQQAIDQSTLLLRQFPNSSEAYNIQGASYESMKNNSQAINNYEKALKINPNYIDAYVNLGLALKDKGDLSAAVVNFKKALKLNPHDTAIYCYMGNTLLDKGELDSAIEHYKNAIRINLNFAEAHFGIGLAQKMKGNLYDAEESLNTSIELKPNYPEAQYYLASIFFENNKITSSEEHLSNVILIDAADIPIRPAHQFVSKLISENNQTTTDLERLNLAKEKVPEDQPLVMSREVDNELVACLYEMHTRGLDSTADARHGKGRCSLDFNLFDSKIPAIKQVSEDLRTLIEETLCKDFYHADSFFNILSKGGGTTPHNHINRHDNEFKLSAHKYSLVYYLAIGDQKTDEPGFLRFYNPDFKILPEKGMVVIVPAKRDHSAIYTGLQERVMIGLNFYAI